jgi:hypothetical protein
VTQTITTKLATWTVSTTLHLPGRSLIEAGTEVSIRGERGRFRFLRHVTTTTGPEWVDVYGGAKGHETLRSFRPERIRTVHRDRRLRGEAV